MRGRRSNLAPVAMRGMHSRIYRVPEIRSFLDGLSRHPFTIDEIRSKLVERFGIDHTPSRSAIGRYVRRLRLHLGIDFTRIDALLTPDR